MIDLYEHNKESYEKIMEMFKTENRATVIQPTGTGKSFLMLKLIEDYQDENIVVLTASNAIANQLYEYAIEFDSEEILRNVKLYTYSKFLRISNKDIKSLQADKIIIDEFHRTGASAWYKKVNVLLESHKNSKVLGLSATPIRYLDNARNMVEEIFDNNIANELTLGDAVYRGILPIFKYISASYTHEDIKYILENIKRIPDKEERLKKLKEYKDMIYNIDQANKIENLFKENIEDKSGKFIVFCKSIAHTKECAKLLENWFRKINMNVKIFISTSKDYDKDNQLDKFISNKQHCIRLLLTVNRFNEGLHIKDLSGVIMMRPTTSPIIYLQQLGRALSVNNKNPLIFDIVNNYSYIIPYMNNYSNNSSGNPFYDQYMKAFESEYEGKNINFNIFAKAIKYNNLIKELEEKLYFNIEDQWNFKFELLKEFKEKYNRFPKYNEVYKDINLGQWISSQKKIF